MVNGLGLYALYDLFLRLTASKIISVLLVSTLYSNLWYLSANKVPPKISHSKTSSKNKTKNSSHSVGWGDFYKRSNIRRAIKRYDTNHTNYGVICPTATTLANWCVHRINLASCCPWIAQGSCYITKYESLIIQHKTSTGISVAFYIVYVTCCSTQLITDGLLAVDFLASCCQLKLWNLPTNWHHSAAVLAEIRIPELKVPMVCHCFVHQRLIIGIWHVTVYSQLHEYVIVSEIWKMELECQFPHF